MVPNLQLVPAPADHIPSPDEKRRYLQAVGSLMYAMLGTRPDIAHAVGVLGRHSANPGPLHWAAVVHVLRYLKGTLDYGLEFNPDNSPLTGFEAYSDSDWSKLSSSSDLTSCRSLIATLRNLSVQINFPLLPAHHPYQRLLCARSETMRRLDSLQSWLRLIALKVLCP
ncbi:uncharacterized protein JCM6883_005672 [Sporobolomyces salmoneus]|uniref:uncharacterized protein n=1 Tax=Sporobolomyces salmoneus TaxID=183962 RepID=UPI0031772418